MRDLSEFGDRVVEAEGIIDPAAAVAAQSETIPVTYTVGVGRRVIICMQTPR
jgi:hypothetical protein